MPSRRARAKSGCEDAPEGASLSEPHEDVGVLGLAPAVFGQGVHELVGGDLREQAVADQADELDLVDGAGET